MLCLGKLCKVWPISSFFLLSVLPLCFFASATCKCSIAHCLPLFCQRCKLPNHCVHGVHVRLIFFSFWEATKYLIKKKQAGRGKQFSLTWMDCHETKNISAIPGNFKGCLQMRQVSELLKKVAKVFVVESVMCLILKCAYQLFPLIANETSYVKIAKYKFYWGWWDSCCWIILVFYLKYFCSSLLNNFLQKSTPFGLPVNLADGRNLKKAALKVN